MNLTKAPMAYTYKIHDGQATVFENGENPLTLTLDELRAELDEASQRQPYDLAWMTMLQEAIDALLDGQDEVLAAAQKIRAGRF